MSSRSNWKSFIARHLYFYLAGICAVVVVIGAIFGRESLSAAWRALDPIWLVPALSLTLVNYALRFTKWDRMLRDCGIEVPRPANARLYFATLAMVVTPGRLGELYKLVFLRRLHGVPASRSLSPLVMERLTDAMAVVLLALLQPFSGRWGLMAVLVGAILLVATGAVLARPTIPARVARWCGHIPRLRERATTVESGLHHHRVLLLPRSLAPALALSLVGWWAECGGLYCILRGLGFDIGLTDATWIYAVSTLLGNLTLLPGGLGLTEVTLVALLGGIGVSQEIGIGATALVRAATLWFAVLLGLSVSLVYRRSLQWNKIRSEAGQAQTDA